MEDPGFEGSSEVGWGLAERAGQLEGETVMNAAAEVADACVAVAVAVVLAGIVDTEGAAAEGQRHKERYKRSALSAQKQQGDCF